METNPDGLKIIGKYKAPVEPLCHYESAVNELVTYPINNNQFSALVSFATCRGVASLSRSVLLQKVNHGQPFQAAREFGRWVRQGGKRRTSLARRRAMEAKLFLTPIIVVGG